jgi:hypothetical protein
VRYFKTQPSPMKMTIKPILYLTVLLFSTSIYGQISLTNPLICHDKDNYLKCYNDGTYRLTFGNGNFNELKTDSTFIYSDVDKSFAFFRKTLYPLSFDTLTIKQLSHSILLTNGTEKLEITDLTNISSRLNDFGVGTYSLDGVIRGLSFNSGDKFFKIEIWTYGKTWHWSFIMKQFNQRLTIDYNGYRGNRIQNIIIQDDDLQYGIAISTTFKTLKKIKRFISFYAPLEQRTSATSYSIIPLDKSYKYEYNRRGKLITKTVIGNLEVCNCN